LIKKNLLITSLFLLCIYLPLTAENVVVAESTQSTATERNNARLIVEDQNGILHVVYYDDGIYYSYSNDNGQNWLVSPIMITSVGRNPSIALDSNNILHLVYKKGGTYAFDIVHRIYNGSWSEEDVVHHDSGTTVSRPVISIDNENNLHCVWQRHGFSSTPNSEIWYKKYSSGSGWTGLENISNTYGASEYPTLAIDNEKNIYTFWKDSGENIYNDKMVLFRKYTEGIGWDTNYTNVSNTTGNGSYATMDPCAITDSENNVHLVWKDSESGTREIYYKKCTNGNWDNLPTNLSNLSTASGRPSICVDNSDNLFVIWEGKIGGNYYDIVYKMFDKNNGNWSELYNISNTSQCDSRHPSCPIRKEDYLYTIWTEGDDFPFSIIINSCHFVDVDQDDLTNEFDLYLQQNFPNPFSFSTTISFSITTEFTENTELIIYNLKGQKIRTFQIPQSEISNPNSVVWNGTDDNNNSVPPGIYFYQLKVGNNFNETKQMLLLK